MQTQRTGLPEPLTTPRPTCQRSPHHCSMSGAPWALAAGTSSRSFPRTPCPLAVLSSLEGREGAGEGRTGQAFVPQPPRPAFTQPTATLFPTPGSPRPEVRPGSPRLVCRGGSRGPEGSPSPSREVWAHLRSQDVPQPGLTFSSHVSRVPGRRKGAPGLGGCTHGAGLPRGSLEM